jgi:catechol 2,3-dioxygenase-like lactoylglutathione lyase family enzyme
MTRFLAVFPVSDEDLKALPVADLDAAIAFYARVLRFSVVQRDTSAATLCRDGINIGLVFRDDHEPGRAGSLAFEVDDLAATHAELQASGGRPGEFGEDEWAGLRHRTFFIRENENGYCYCFFHTLDKL